MEDGRYASFAKAEQLARDLTFHPHQLDAADRLFHVPRDTVYCQAESPDKWPGADRVEKLGGLHSFMACEIFHSSSNIIQLTEKPSHDVGVMDTVLDERSSAGNAPTFGYAWMPCTASLFGFTG